MRIFYWLGLVSLLFNSPAAMANAITDDASASAGKLLAKGHGKQQTAFLGFAQEVMLLKIAVEICAAENGGDLARCNSGAKPVPDAAGTITGSSSKNGSNTRAAMLGNQQLNYLAAFAVHPGGVIYAESIAGKGAHGETLQLTPVADAKNGFVWRVSGTCVRAGLCRATNIPQSTAAMDAYRQYTVRSRFSQIMSYLDGYKTAVALCLSEHAAHSLECKAGSYNIPQNAGVIGDNTGGNENNARPLADAEFLSAVRVDEGGIITARTITDSYLHGETIILAPAIVGDEIEWQTSGSCLQTGLCGR